MTTLDRNLGTKRTQQPGYKYHDAALDLAAWGRLVAFTAGDATRTRNIQLGRLMLYH